MPNEYYVYMMTNESRTSLYTGVTNNLERRVWEHQNGMNDGFTKRYRMTRLVYFETTDDIGAAIAREKQIKGLLRSKKAKLVASMNPDWKDLAGEWYG